MNRSSTKILRRLVPHSAIKAASRLSTIRYYAAIIGVFMIAGASLHSGFLATRDTWRSFKAGTPDFAVAYRQRMNKVIPLLPPRGTIGYISDYNDEGEFYLTQYLLVPLVLEKGQRPDLVLVNNHVALAQGGLPEGYIVSKSTDGSQVYDFGNGIKLIDRRHQP